MYRLRLDPRIEKQVDRLQGPIWQRILDALNSLRTTPRPKGCVKLQGMKGTYRIRIGDYRILYHIDDADQLITILRIKHRREAYRN